MKENTSKPQFQNTQATFDLGKLDRERLATQCVCCGGRRIVSSPAVLMPFVAHRTFGWAPVTIDESWGLKSIPSGKAYSICKSLCCMDCQFLFMDIRFSESELHRLYHDYRGNEYNDLREFYEPGYLLRNEKLISGIEYIDEIEEFLKPHLKFPITILDWGGDTGKNTPFKNDAKCLEIYDISDKPTIYAISKQDALSKKYDLIICSNVLEHIPFPSDLLTDIILTMTLESILYIEVPFEDIFKDSPVDFHIKKKHWHEHINFYSQKSILKLVENSGLDTISFNIIDVTTGGKRSSQIQMACRIK